MVGLGMARIIEGKRKLDRQGRMGEKIMLVLLPVNLKSQRTRMEDRS